MRPILSLAALLALSLAMAACDGGSEDTSDGGSGGIAITTTSLAPATAGAAYNQALTADAGGTWSVSAGALPAGLSLAGSAISGTPTLGGVFAFTLTIADGAASDERPFTLTVYPALQVLTDSLPLAVAGIAYGETIAAYGGAGGFSWQLSAGSLPSGLTLSATGTPAAALSGTPSAPGTYNFTANVTDSLGNIASRALSLQVAAPLTIGTTAISPAVRGEFFSAPLAASGGNPASLSWNLTAGSLPVGLSIGANGSPYTLLQGVPTSAGTATFTLQVTDASLNVAARQLEVRVYEPGTIVTFAGDGATYLPGGPNGDGGLATLAQFNAPQGLAFDSKGNAYVGERSGYRVRKIDAATHIVTTYAGDGTTGVAGGPDSLFPAPSSRLATTAKFVGITDLKVDAQDNLWILDGDGHALHKVDNQTGFITTVVGTGIQGYAGDNGAASAAQLNGSYAFALAPNGDIFIADTFNYRIRKVSGGVITTAAGNGTPGTSGDGALAINAQIAFITGLCADAQGNVYLGGGSSAPPDIHSRVRKIDAAGVITTVAGTGAQGFSGDGGLATAATFNRPASLCVDAQGNLYICDMRVTGGNARVRKVDAVSGVVTTIAGTGLLGYSGDGGLGTLADISGPFTPAVDARGNLYFCDTGNNRVRVVLKP